MDKLAEVRAYYERTETRIGFNLVMGGSKHFGFYPDGTANIDEHKAQVNMQELLARRLQVGQDDLVLDAGCGQGIVATYLAKKFGCCVSGITIVPFEVQSARRLARKLGLSSSKTSFTFMDYSHMNFPDNCFDALYTMEALVHSPDVRQTLTEFYRVLKPGGRFALFEYTLDEDEKFSNEECADLDWVIKQSAMHGLKSFRHDKFPKLVESARFENVSQENISANMAPSFLRLYKKARHPYKIVKLLRLEETFPNATIAVKLMPICQKGLVRYCIFTAQKPVQ